MEHTLGANRLMKNEILYNVLILVLVEHTLGVLNSILFLYKKLRLNPCFSGTYSRRSLQKLCSDYRQVLILVLVEHTLGGRP